jgi:guanosine-3',5'-bis(diphosphate) 3'-pyrophosphohydrolase
VTTDVPQVVRGAGKPAPGSTLPAPVEVAPESTDPVDGLGEPAESAAGPVGVAEPADTVGCAAPPVSEWPDTDLVDRDLVGVDLVDGDLVDAELAKAGLVEAELIGPAERLHPAGRAEWSRRAEAPGPAAPEPSEPSLQQRVRGLVTRSVMAGRRRAGGSGIDPLLSMHQSMFPQIDAAPLRRAYDVAAAHHRGQLRKSGEPFITHPLAVATILAELGMDTTTLVAALLHDTVEDTGYTISQSQADFGLTVAHLIDGVTKLDRVRFGEAAEAETIRKMIVAAGRDLRVLVIKLADRLHNMRTLRYQPQHKQDRIARGTLDFLAPLADRLGIHVLKRELESLCFATLQPREYAQTVRLVAERATDRQPLTAQVIRQVEADLRAAQIQATVSDRPRHSFSVFRTTLERGGTVGELRDSPRILITVRGEPGDCYATLGAVHCRWRPVPGRFRDYIALPKFNMYQSLHTTVLGPDREPVDVLIRTEHMHRVAEYGIAAHVQEAAMTGARPDGVAGGPSQLEWMRRLLGWQREVGDAGEFFRTLRTDLGGDREVLVFTPKGEALTLPDRGTPVDFAYAVRSDIGHRTVAARVNGRLVPLACPLSDGDVVDVMTSESENPGPSWDWLEFVRTPNAHVKIRQWFAEQSRDGVIEFGRQQLDQAFRDSGRSLEEAVEDGSLLVTALELGYRQVEELYAAVADGKARDREVVERAAELADLDFQTQPATPPKPGGRQ